MKPSLPLLLLSAFLPGILASSIVLAADTPLQTSATQKVSPFQKQFRTQSYIAYPPVKSTAAQLKTNSYSQFENPTGIAFAAGETITLDVAPLQEQTLELRITDFSTERMQDSSYPLKSGKNTIVAKNSGHGYISYFTDKYKTARPVTISIAGGTVNGYFDSSRHTNRDWKNLLASATSPILDIRGKYVQLAYPVAALREQCPGDGLGLIGIYDRIISIQQEIMGLDKYKCRPKNHMFGRVIWKGFMHADGYGAAFHNNTMKNLANIAAIKKDPWGIAHEFGHVNQVRPGMKWAGTGETTNNIYSIWTKYLFSPEYINLEHHKKDDTFGNRVEGGRFNAYLNSAVIAGEPWIALKGPDKMKDYERGNGDHFVKLCPLWQLMLYFQVAGKGNPDFLPDIFQKVRQTDESGISHGQLHTNFLKNLCDATRQNLTGFFKASGMLTPIDRNIRDYGDYQLTITQKDCDDVVAYASKYPQPESPVIHYMTSGSVKAYKEKLPVSGQYEQGITAGEGNLNISADAWKNVTVFETYKGDTLERISILYTGSPDKTYTIVPYPEGSTRIEAVSWDGKRTLVYGTRSV